MADAEFTDDEVVIQCVDIFIVDDPSNHARASEHEHVRIGCVNCVDPLVPQQFDTRYLGLARAANERDPEDLAERLRLVEVVRLEKDGCEFLFLEFKFLFDFLFFLGRDRNGRTELRDGAFKEVVGRSIRRPDRAFVRCRRGRWRCVGLELLFDPRDVLLSVFFVGLSFLDGFGFLLGRWPVKNDDGRDPVGEQLRYNIHDPYEMTFVERHITDDVSEAVRTAMRASE